MSRLFRFLARRPDEVAMVDTTGGTVQPIKLTDNGVPKVLLRLVKNGVSVEMALPKAQAEDFLDELEDAVQWVRTGGDRD